MSDSMADLLKAAFDEILPIPKTPRVYRPPPPQKRARARLRMHVQLIKDGLDKFVGF